MNTKIRLLMVEDHQIVSDGLLKLIQDEEDIEVVNVIDNAQDALEFIENNQIDVVMSDITMPGMSGLEFTQIVAEKYITPKVLLLSMHEDEEYVLTAVDNGAMGYLTKDVKRSELLKAIRKVANGEKHFSPKVTEIMITGYANRASRVRADKDKPDSQLTERELEILGYIVKGFSNKQIGYELDISKRTVDTHRTNIMKKLDAKNTAMIVKEALDRGLVSDE
ncbi:MAG: response regulator transcription factor [Cyclobacteriaceae bacterium]|nr:response regulator transcription factor [Cyclobacteriaceae bacterium]